ncbi:MAG: topoisomerase IIA [Solivirus sp.]|uniref:DNA topoisomerase 2 n=1 Tax=Solivirus sp. TaxID=2487772 RepID=A0A3G5AFN9_9VIRU|nr:MAG: topoisomerase IIA [Solivirus sp.]
MQNQVSQVIDASAYKRLSDIDHVLHRLSMYIGSGASESKNTICLVSGQDPQGPQGKQISRLGYKFINETEAMAQLFLEVLANASDNLKRTKDFNTKNKANIEIGNIEVTLTPEYCSMKNYGIWIPIQMHPTEGMYAPQLIFGNLRSSSNYDDDDDASLLGTNGLGVKVVNILSKMFMVVCADPERGLLYKQTWSNNMKSVSQPEIVPYTGIGFTQVTYSLEFPRLFSNGFNQESIEVYMAQCSVISFTRGVPIIFNGQPIQVANLLEYVKMFFPAISKENSISFISEGKHYEVCLCDTPNSGISVAIVNGVLVKNGGVHMDEIMTNVMQSIKTFFGKDMDGVQFTRRDIIPHVSLFVSATLVKPNFNSQSKDYLEGLKPLKGSDGRLQKRPLPSAIIPERLLKHMRSWKLIEIIHEEIERKQMNKLKKKEKKNKGKTDVETLTDANFSQTKDPNFMQQASLLICEGESASNFPKEFISNCPGDSGRNLFGILPLHGKLRNALNANFLQLMHNIDFDNLKEAIGLTEGADYRIVQNRMTLRYGRIVAMPDADEDGAHILGLLLLYFLVRFPTLIDGQFFNFLRTPVIIVSKSGTSIKFYKNNQYLEWKLATGNYSTWKHKYFKGLGSANSDLIREIYMQPITVQMIMDATTKESIELAFKKIDADSRKMWLANFFNAVTYVPVERYQALPISIFINHELINYSVETLSRALPEMMDGLKDSQRKILFTAMTKLKGGAEPRVQTLAGAVIDKTAYKHGDQSLCAAIAIMTQDYVGANNMSYFYPDGLFGTRQAGGTDVASPRYTHVGMNWWIPLIFRPEDRELEVPIIDEGEEQECESFFPIIPMHMANGCVGIATGYSCTHFSFNPLDLAFALQMRLIQAIKPNEKVPMPNLVPYVKGWKGTVEMGKNGFISKGKFDIQRDGSILITELPMGVWTNKYEKFLDALENSGEIDSVSHFSLKDTIKIVVKGMKDPSFKKLKLQRSHSTSNMTVLYRRPDRKVQPVIYNDIQKMLDDFFKLRLPKYQERKNLRLKSLKEEIEKMTNKAKFITLVNTGEIVILKRKEAEVYSKMNSYQLPHELYHETKAREFSEERAAELLNKVEKRKEEFNILLSTPIEALWYNDLEEFVQKYSAREKVPRSTYESTGVVQEYVEIVEEEGKDELTNEIKDNFDENEPEVLPAEKE